MAARADAYEGVKKNVGDMADAPLGSINAGEYKNAVAGPIVLGYVSDAFESRLMGESPRLATDQRGPAAWTPVQGSHHVG